MESARIILNPSPPPQAHREKLSSVKLVPGAEKVGTDILEVLVYPLESQAHFSSALLTPYIFIKAACAVTLFNQ